MLKNIVFSTKIQYVNVLATSVVHTFIIWKYFIKIMTIHIKTSYSLHMWCSSNVIFSGPLAINFAQKLAYLTLT